MTATNEQAIAVLGCKKVALLKIVKRFLHKAASSKKKVI